MFCSKYGKQIDDKATACEGCGSAVTPIAQIQANNAAPQPPYRPNAPYQPYAPKIEEDPYKGRVQMAFIFGIVSLVYSVLALAIMFIEGFPGYEWLLLIFMTPIALSVAGLWLSVYVRPKCKNKQLTNVNFGLHGASLAIVLLCCIVSLVLTV